MGEGSSTTVTEPISGTPGASPDEELSRVLQIRRDKLAQIRARGLEPFAYVFDRSHTAGAAKTAFEQDEAASRLDASGAGATVKVAGRVVSWRDHGKSAFGHIEDASGKVQLYFKADALGAEPFADLKLLDLGDWIGVEGALFRTRTGEVTVRVQGWELLTKSLRPLPLGKTEVDAATGQAVQHSAFTGTEARYRQRYADLAVHADVREVFRQRTRIVTSLRTFMDGEGFLSLIHI